MVAARRLIDRPIIGPELGGGIGENIQGPSLIRVPSWVKNPLGAYYLYFADHKGSYIRLAYADALEGPWTIHEPGSLHLAESRFLTAPPAVTDAQVAEAEARMAAMGMRISHDARSEISTPHIASPDVHVDHANRRILMYFHGLEDVGDQVSRLAFSEDGIAFAALPEVIGRSYMRIFRHGDWHYALTMPGRISRSRDGIGGWVDGPLLFNPNMRHAAVRKRANLLDVFWTQVGDVPERILLSVIDLSGDWMGWREGPATEVLRPERDWEGALAPLEPSIRSTAYGRVNQLRDPAVFEEEGRCFLLYAVGGESGIGIAEVFEG